MTVIPCPSFAPGFPPDADDPMSSTARLRVGHLGAEEPLDLLPDPVILAHQDVSARFEDDRLGPRDPGRRVAHDISSLVGVVGCADQHDRHPQLLHRQVGGDRNGGAEALTAVASFFFDSRIWASRRRMSARSSAASSPRACPAVPDGVADRRMRAA